MSHATHDTHGAGAAHAKNPPTLPKVVDEAGDTPGWVPAVGLLLLVLVAASVQLSSLR